MDVNKYKQVMETIKGRKDHIDWITDNAESMGKISIFMVESICLQLRKTIEDIAVACVIANEDELPELAHTLRREYRPNRILNRLKESNPECYPVPMVENVDGSHGRLKDTYDRPEGDWLAMSEVVEEYGRLNDALHQSLKSYNRGSADIGALYQRCGYLDSKICNLLSHHQITVLKEDTMYRVLMAASGTDENGTPFSGRVQLAVFGKITNPDAGVCQ